MMSQRFSLFYAGLTSYLPALYFKQSEFVSSYDVTEAPELEMCLQEFSQKLNDTADEANSHLKTAISIAKHFDLEPSTHPQTHYDYHTWLEHYISLIEREFPMSRIDHYYFLFGRKIAEIHCNTLLVKGYTDLLLQCKQGIDLSARIEKCIKDNEYILFKLMAAAALISSEPRQNYFNVYYRSLCNEFNAFKEFERNFSERHQLKKLQTCAKEYDLLVMDGFKKCIGILKELEI